MSSLPQSPVSGGASTSADDLPTSLSDNEFEALRKLTRSMTGIRLDDSKRSMMYARIVRRLRALGLKTFADYIKEVERAGSSEIPLFVNTVTTNLTYFFREEHHFEVLSKKAVPAVSSGNRTGEPMRIWSAGCSSGEEPYSVAIVMNELGKQGGLDYKLLCTDLDTDMVDRTTAGRFVESSVRGLSPERRSKWFQDNGHEIQAKPELRAGMIVKALNLFKPWPLRDGVDIIFCRNVLIYFDREDQDKIISGFARKQHPGAFLFLGHSESMRGFDSTYRRVDNTVYQRL